jgi:hypothetical protein
VVTAAILGIPHAISHLFSNNSPLTISGTAGPEGDKDSSDNGPVIDTAGCFGGAYLMPGKVALPNALSPSDFESITTNGIFGGGVYGGYVVQAKPGQVVVVTGIHTVLIKRVPTPQYTEVIFESSCANAPPAGDRDYHAYFNLDSNNLLPELTVGTGESQHSEPVNQIKATVTDDNPIYIDLTADTTKYDVTFKVRIDYTVNGKMHTGWIQDGSRPFHAVADSPDNLRIYYIYNYRERRWVIDNV